MLRTCDLPGNGDIFSKQVEGRLDLSSSWTSLPPSRFSSSWNHLLPETFALARSMLLITLVLFILCSTSESLPSARPETGTYLKDMHRDGYGLLTIHNKWTMDTVAVLTDANIKPLVAVYIRAKDSLNITKIKDGNYNLYFTVGNDWDEKDGRFGSILGYYRYRSPLVFETAENEDDIEYSVFELDLYEADASNFLPDQFQFPDLSS
jgi:hypothetical protein